MPFFSVSHWGAPVLLNRKYANILTFQGLQNIWRTNSRFYCPLSIEVVFLIFTEVYLIYHAVLITAVQQSDSVIHTYPLFSTTVYHRILNIVPWAI